MLENEEIARRYFIMNSFDGALTIFGIIVAIYVSGIENTRIIVVSCIGAAISMGVSGIWGAYAAERAERIRKLKDLERHLMQDLDETHVGRRTRMMTMLVALVDGISPVLVSAVIIIPFLMADLGFHSVQTAFKLSITIVAIILLSLGAVTGRIAGERILPNALKMVSAGLVVAVISVLLEQLKVI